MGSNKLVRLACVLLSLSLLLVGGCKGKGGKGKADSNVSDTRKQTLFVNGLQYGPPSNFNILSGNSAFPCSGSNLLLYETLFMYNSVTGGIEPLLAKSYKWINDSVVEVKMNPDAKWSDGQPLTAKDVAYTYMLGKRYTVSWSSNMKYFDSVVAKGDETVVLNLSKKNYNRPNVADTLQGLYILPKHIWSEIEAKHNKQIEEIRKEFNENPVGSGAYKVKYYDETKITLERDNNYWGQSLFGKLPAPKFITHVIFKSNDAGNLALKNGEVDCSQEFIPQVWKMWEDGAPIKTYLPEKPYYIPGAMPSIIFNTTKKGLKEVAVRKAIAQCIDYKKIGQVAMSGYTADIKPSLTLPTASEAKYIDQKKVAPLRWKTDIAAANKLLDSIGAKPGEDGVRVLKDGTKLSFDIECPFGWSDWNASLEIVSQNAKKIGVELKTKFPEAPVWGNDKATGNFDIIMDSPAASLMPSQPYARANSIMFSEDVPPVGQQAFWNFGRFKNERADAILKAIPKEKDIKKLKVLYTELDTIYLKNLPTIPLMYRPWMFFTVNESVWKGFPQKDDGTKIPPQCCVNGAGIRALYEIHN